MEPSGIALDDPASFADGHPHDQYRQLRENQPVWFHPEREGAGFWAVTGYREVVEVSRDPETYSSWLGGVMMPDSDPAMLDGSRLMMLFQDPPQHTRYRRLVSRAFTPKAAQSWRHRLDRLAIRIVDSVIERGECEFVSEVAGEMPSLVIAELMGIRAGQKVIVFYGAANRDTSVWPDADRLDLSRSPNHHLAFGGGGTHMCLGAHFARLETASILRQVATRMHDLAIAGPVERLTSTFIAGPRSLPVTFRPGPVLG